MGFLSATSLYGTVTSRIKLNVPFDLSVSGQVIPAGQYTIDRPLSCDASVLHIQNDDGSQGVFFIANSAQNTNGEEGGFLVFTILGEKYALPAYSPGVRPRQ